MNIANELLERHKIIRRVTVKCFGHLDANTILVTLVKGLDIVLFYIVPRTVFITQIIVKSRFHDFSLAAQINNTALEFHKADSPGHKHFNAHTAVRTGCGTNTVVAKMVFGHYHTIGLKTLAGIVAINHTTFNVAVIATLHGLEIICTDHIVLLDF
jgi:hypothetical protein